MKIYVEVAEWFKRFTGGNGRMEIGYNQGISALEAVVSCGIPKDEIGFISIIKSNNENMIISEEYLLNEGDVLKVYPQIIGG